MRINEDHHLVVDADEGLSYRYEASRHKSRKPQEEPRALIIHAPPAGNKISATISAYANSGKSRHLIIGRDGKEIVQLLPFDQGAVHAFGYDKKSIAIELQYPGELVKKAFRYDPSVKPMSDQYILGTSMNNSRYGDWPLFPREQLDLLFKIAKMLKNRYRIVDVLGYEESFFEEANRGWVTSRTDPGPAFPIIQLREKLGITRRSFILQETSRAVSLLGQPGNAASQLEAGVNIPRKTPMSVVNEMGSWYLIAVAAEINGNPWRMGWVEKSAIRVNINLNVKVNTHHYLTDDQGRKFPEIMPHKNGFRAKPDLDPKYIIMHYTTGMKMESTIAHFKSPSSGVSTHLLIGRDGRVVQFLPFNRIAHHCGFSWWEGEYDLNRFSIGIELDNAGRLSKWGDKWMARKLEIPPENVEQAWYWKLPKPRTEASLPGWETFTKIQLKVALEIVKALKRKYPSIKEILGHDEVNIINRSDPGPLFPWEQFRMALFNKKEPEYIAHKIKDPNPVTFYRNINGVPPNVERNRDESIILKKGANVEILREDEYMAFIRVKKSKDPDLSGWRGWVEKLSFDEPDRNPRVRRTTKNQPLLPGNIGLAPTPAMREKLKSNQNDRRIRIQKYSQDNKWALVVVLPTGNEYGFEGWIRKDQLETADHT
jgi:N-acetylmuramoyl-L-alanine amidase